ncbi:MAG: hypothetical protein HUU54_04015 [Ignavibacteriaceae bacterium]|nr:hypothetical protein [Ignavibacteriaceae bacterium]
MAKKLSDIELLVNESNHSFVDYLQSNFDKRVIDLLNELSEETDIYIFSGVIRNYFLKINENRDLDLVLEKEIELQEHLSNYKKSVNSFGGYKIEHEKLNIDLWFMNDTWSVKNHQLTLNYELDKYIPQTAFFNFSAVMFSYKRKEFICTKYFLRFLRDKKLELVYAPNPNNALCIVNTFYYSEKYKMKIGDKLKVHIKKISVTNLEQTIDVQIKHFGRVIYSIDDLKSRIDKL